MKRRAFKLVLFLLAGAIINVAVAWAPFFRLTEVSPVPSCSRAWPFESEFGPEVGTVLDSCFDWWLPVDCQEACLRAGEIQHLPTDVSRVYFTSGDTWAVAVAPQDISTTGPSWYSANRGMNIRWAAGWPTRCVEGFQYVRAVDMGYARDPFFRTSDGLIAIGSIHIPLGPLSPGFAINTIFYAAVLWVLFAVPVKVRRWRRIKRGQCASLRGTPDTVKCPECGATV